MIYASALSDGIHNLMTMESAAPEVRMRCVVAKLRSVHALLAAARSNIVRPPRVFVERAQPMLRGVSPLLDEELPMAFRSVNDAGLQSAMKQAAGQPVASLTAPGTPGFNRVVWDLKPGKDVLTEYGGEGQKFVRPGEYEVTLTYGKTTQKQKITVAIAEGIQTR